MSRVIITANFDRLTERALKEVGVSPGHKRFTRWARAGVREEVFEVLTNDSDNEYLLIDTTIVRAHQQAATGKGAPKRGSP